MNRYNPSRIALVVAMLALAFVATSTFAMDLDWYTMEGSSVMDMMAPDHRDHASSDLALSGTIGQASASVLSADDFVLYSGFWAITQAPGPGDVNADGVVDFTDLLIIISDWGPCHGCLADLNGDEMVDFFDLIIVVSNWSTAP